MLLPNETELTHWGELASQADNDLIHELSRRLDSISRYDQYIKHAGPQETLRQFWCAMKLQEEQNIKLLKELLAEELRHPAL